MSDTAIDQAVPTAVQDDREVTSNKSSNSSIGREDEEIAAFDKEQQPSQSSLEIANKFSDIEPSQLLQYIAETNQVREPWETIREAVKEAIVKVSLDADSESGARFRDAAAICSGTDLTV